jgi:hypothetical protein
VVGIISPEMSLLEPEKTAQAEAVDRIADGVARYKFWFYRRPALL